MASNKVPGAFPVTPANELQSFLSPIPASEGVGNPVQLAPGEKVPEPSTLHANTLTSKVHDDPELIASARDAPLESSVYDDDVIRITGKSDKPNQLIRRFRN